MHQRSDVLRTRQTSKTEISAKTANELQLLTVLAKNSMS